MKAPRRERQWTGEQVAEMRALWRSGRTAPDLAALFGGGTQPVYQALYGITYRDVPRPITVAERRARRPDGRKVPPIRCGGMWVNARGATL